MPLTFPHDVILSPVRIIVFTKKKKKYKLRKINIKL